MDKKIPKKNYIIYAFIVIITLALVIYATEWYKAYKQSELDNSYITKYVNEINFEEFENYTLENPNNIIYIGKTNCEECLKLEKNLYKIIKKNELVDETVFLNVTNFNDLNKITDKYNIETLKSNINVPSIAILKDSKITDVLVGNEKNIITSDLINQLLEEYEYIK